MKQLEEVDKSLSRGSKRLYIEEINQGNIEMPDRRHLTLYRLRDTIDGNAVDFKNVLKGSKTAKEHLPSNPGTLDFEAKLLVATSQPEQPAWTDLFDGDFADLKIPKVRRVDGLLLVRISIDGNSPMFALTFGQGRHLLKPEVILPSHGLTVALNAIYRGSDSADHIRSVDSKTIDQNVINTRRQADRRTSFDRFLVDTSHDFLRSIVGRPTDPRFWGGRLSGSNSLSTAPEIDFKDIGAFCRQVHLTFKKGRPKDFAWTETLQAVDDASLRAKLFDKSVEVLSQTDDLVLAIPEIIEWDNVAFFSATCLPDLKFLDPEELDLTASLAALEKPKKVTLANLRKWKLEGYDGADKLLYSWSLLRCLSGQFEFDGNTYVVSEGEFYRVEPDFLKRLNKFIEGIKPTGLKFPIAIEDPPEGEYNELAANSSDQYLLLDKQTVKLDTQTSPIEVCDLLTEGGAFVHVKRKLGSSSLSHLFAQGSVSADLLLMSPEFRRKFDAKITAAENLRVNQSNDEGFKGKFQRFKDVNVDPRKHEIVYAVAAQWKGRKLVEALPFFSKINLRRHVEELRRMGYSVTFAKIEATPRPKTD